MCLEVNSSKKKAVIGKICFKDCFIQNDKDARSLHYSNQLYQKGVRQPDVNIKVEDFVASEGYHSWSLPCAKQLFVIPRGAEFYKGEQYDGDRGYVSSSIIWVGSARNPINWLKALYYKLK